MKSPGGEGERVRSREHYFLRRGPTISTHTHGRHQNPSLPFLFLVAATQTTSFPQSKIFFFLFCVYLYYCNFLYLVYARFFSISFIPKRENQTPLRTSKFQEETSEETENRRLADFTLFWVCLAAMETRSRRPSLQYVLRLVSWFLLRRMVFVMCTNSGKGVPSGAFRPPRPGKRLSGSGSSRQSLPGRRLPMEQRTSKKLSTEG
jgi:hypothetical protein